MCVKSYTYLGQCKLVCQYFFFFQYLCADEAQSVSEDTLLQDYDITVRQNQKIQFVKLRLVPDAKIRQWHRGMRMPHKGIHWYYKENK